MVVAKSFTKFAYRQETKSPHPVKLLVVDDNEEENKLVENLKDFVDLNLCALVKKEGIEVVLHNSNVVVDMDKRIKELKEQVEQALKRGEEREKELQMDLWASVKTILHILVMI